MLANPVGGSTVTARDVLSSILPKERPQCAAEPMTKAGPTDKPGAKHAAGRQLQAPCHESPKKARAARGGGKQLKKATAAAVTAAAAELLAPARKAKAAAAGASAAAAPCVAEAPADKAGQGRPLRPLPLQLIRARPPPHPLAQPAHAHPMRQGPLPPAPVLPPPGPAPHAPASSPQNCGSPDDDVICWSPSPVPLRPGEHPIRRSPTPPADENAPPPQPSPQRPLAQPLPLSPAVSVGSPIESLSSDTGELPPPPPQQPCDAANPDGNKPRSATASPRAEQHLQQPPGQAPLWLTPVGAAAHATGPPLACTGRHAPPTHATTSCVAASPRLATSVGCWVTQTPASAAAGGTAADGNAVAAAEEVEAERRPDPMDITPLRRNLPSIPASPLMEGLQGSARSGCPLEPGSREYGLGACDGATPARQQEYRCNSPFGGVASGGGGAPGACNVRHGQVAGSGIGSDNIGGQSAAAAGCSDMECHTPARQPDPVASQESMEDLTHGAANGGGGGSGDGSGIGSDDDVMICDTPLRCANGALDATPPLAAPPPPPLHEALTGGFACQLRPDAADPAWRSQMPTEPAAGHTKSATERGQGRDPMALGRPVAAKVGLKRCSPEMAGPQGAVAATRTREATRCSGSWASLHVQQQPCVAAGGRLGMSAAADGNGWHSSPGPAEQTGREAKLQAPEQSGYGHDDGMDEDMHWAGRVAIERQAGICRMGTDKDQDPDCELTRDLDSESEPDMDPEWDELTQQEEQRGTRGWLAGRRRGGAAPAAAAAVPGHPAPKGASGAQAPTFRPAAHAAAAPAVQQAAPSGPALCGSRPLAGSEPGLGPGSRLRGSVGDDDDAWMQTQGLQPGAAGLRGGGGHQRRCGRQVEPCFADAYRYDEDDEDEEVEEREGWAMEGWDGGVDAFPGAADGRGPAPDVGEGADVDVGEVDEPTPLTAAVTPRAGASAHASGGAAAGAGGTRPSPAPAPTRARRRSVSFLFPQMASLEHPKRVSAQPSQLHPQPMPNLPPSPPQAQAQPPEVLHPLHPGLHPLPEQAAFIQHQTCAGAPAPTHGPLPPQHPQFSGTQQRRQRAGARAEPLVGEECSPRFWDGAPDVFEVFPFQRHAMQFADWANAVPAGVLRALQRAAGAQDFPSFPHRWAFLETWMAAHPPPPQQQQEPASGGRSTGDPGCSDGAAPPGAPPPRPLEAVRVFVQEYRRGRRGGGGGGGAAGDGGGAEYSRHFLATTYKAVWRRYQSLAATQRHFYEVIRADRPCHMYFDIEFSRGANPGADGGALVGRLVEELARLLRDTWGVELQPQHVLELESVTEAEAAAAAAAAAAAGGAAAAGEAGPGCPPPPPHPVSDKFSRHLLVRLPGVALAGNGVAGGIVAKLGPALAEAGLCLLKADEPPGGATACIVDPAVYSRVRHFRCVWCSKGGKQAVLRPTSRFMMAPQHSHQPQLQRPTTTHGSPAAAGAAAAAAPSDAPGHAQAQPHPPSPPPLRAQELFLASLICNVHPGARLLELPPGFLDGVPRLPGCGGISRVAAAGGLDGPGARPGGGGGEGRLAFEGTLSHPLTHGPLKLTWAAEPPELHTLPPPQAPPPPPGQAQHPPPHQGHQQGHPIRIDPCVTAAVAPSGAQPAGSGGGSGGGFGGGSGWSTLQRLALAAVGFVETMARDRAGGAETQVRSMAYCGEAASVSYGMIGPGSHFCDRIGRRHRSNHVFFVLDFLRGRYCQKCYDPECAGWRSEWTAMPHEAWQYPAAGCPGGAGGPADGGGGGPVLALAATAAAEGAAPQAGAGGGGVPLQGAPQVLHPPAPQPHVHTWAGPEQAAVAVPPQHESGQCRQQHQLQQAQQQQQRPWPWVAADGLPRSAGEGAGNGTEQVSRQAHTAEHAPGIASGACLAGAALPTITAAMGPGQWPAAGSGAAGARGPVHHGGGRSKTRATPVEEIFGAAAMWR